MTLLIATLLFVALAIAARLWGVDSRDRDPQTPVRQI